MLEEAVDLIDGELGEYVFGAIDQVIKDYVSGLAWIGKYDSLEKKRTLALLFGVQIRRLSLLGMHVIGLMKIIPMKTGGFQRYFLHEQDEQVFGSPLIQKTANANKRTWRAFAIQMNQDFPAIAEAGFLFEVDEGTWFLPWKLDATLTSEKYCIDAIEEALGPVKEALQKIENNAHSSFEKVVHAAREQFR